MIDRITEAIQRRLDEETSSVNVAYLPGAFDTARSLVRDLSRIKKRWNVEILEGEDEYTVMFEEALKVTVPRQYFEKFNSKVVNVTGVTTVDLTGVLNETILEVNKSVYDRLYSALVKDFKQSTVIARSMVLMNSWLRTFPNSRFHTPKGSVAIRLEAFDSSAGTLVKKLQKKYGDDLGGIDALVGSLESGEALGQLQGYLYIAGTTIRSSYLGVTLEVELNINTAMVPSQSLYINSVDVVDALSTYRTVKTLYRKVFPVGQMFAPSIFGNIKDIIEEVDSNA